MMNWQPGITLEEMEREVIITALRFYQWNRTRTADALSISVRTIQNKIALYLEQGFIQKAEFEKIKPEPEPDPVPEPEPEPETENAMRRQMDAAKRKLTLRDRREA
jgi:hypothetical protein